MRRVGGEGRIVENTFLFADPVSTAKQLFHGVLKSSYQQQGAKVPCLKYIDVNYFLKAVLNR